MDLWLEEESKGVSIHFHHLKRVYDLGSEFGEIQFQAVFKLREINSSAVVQFYENLRSRTSSKFQGNYKKLFIGKVMKRF